ncbi:MAG: ABC transporter substrate-binding protein [Methanobacteriota archaeon]
MLSFDKARSIRVFTGVILLIGICICSIGGAESISSDNSTITIYGLFPMNGSLTSGGESSKAAFDLAISDINTFLAKGGSKIQVIGVTTDIGSDSTSALDALKTLHESGVTMVISYLSSNQLEAMKEYADSEGVLILSTGSSVPELSIPNDNILRFNTDDSIQAISTVEVFRQNGITTIIPFARKDIWGQDLIKEVKTDLPDGITMEEGVWYDPNTTSFADSLSNLDKFVGDALKTTDAGNISVYVLSFDELEQILKEAADNGYPNLENVRWIGCDGNALVPAITGTGEVPEYAFKCNFTALSVSPRGNYKNNPVYLSLKKTLGKEPNGYAYGCYDATKIAYMALIMNGNTDAETLRDEIITLSESYVGIAGSAAKNEAGDAQEGHYTLWGMVHNNGEYSQKMLAEVAVWYNFGVKPIPVFYPEKD